MVKDAYRFVVPTFVLAGLCAWSGWFTAAAFFLVTAVYVGYFFRNPRRLIPAGNHKVVSPADGKIVRIIDLPAGDEEMPGGRRISIFLSLFDVHVTRAPVGGRLEHLEYRRGRFKAAFDEAASRVNEMNILTIRNGRICVVVKQIAGLVARRVICWKHPGCRLERGELFGLIRFGSRVDVLLPGEVRILARVGDRVHGGISVIGEIPE